MSKVKSAIPVYDIYSVANTVHLHKEIVAEPFAAYLSTRAHLLHSHRHSFYHVVLFTAGAGTHMIDFEQFTVRKGQIYFMAPGQVHRWNFEGDVDGYVINFSEKLFQSFLAESQNLEQFPFFRSVAKDSVINLTEATMATVSPLFDALIAEVSQSDSYSNSMICALLLNMFIKVSRTLASASIGEVPAHSQLMLHNFKKLVNQYYVDKKLPRDYAALLYITPNHLNALCTNLLGQSAGDAIRDRVILEAKRLLVNASLSISEIAYRLNFKDNSYFTRFFKKYTGITPENFRRSYVDGSLSN